MARFSSPARALRPYRVGREARVFNVLSDFGINRFEELNNYSGLMTRRKNDDSDAHKGLSAGGGHQRRRRLAPPPGTGAAQNQASDDQRGAQPDRLPAEDKTHDQSNRASHCPKLLPPKPPLHPQPDPQTHPPPH